MLALGLASYLSLYPALLFIPLALLCCDQQVKADQPSNVPLFMIRHAVKFLSSIAALLSLSYLITENFWEFMSATYGFHLLVPDLTPNVGLWWYFFIEMFDSFRAFFLGVFWLHLASYVGGFTARLRRQPLFIITALLGVFAIFKPYPSISDASLYFAVLPLYRHIFPRKWNDFPLEVNANLVQLCGIHFSPFQLFSTPVFSDPHSTIYGSTPVPATPTSSTPLPLSGAWAFLYS